MRDKVKKTSGSEELRRRAEERLKSRTADYAKSSPEEARAMLQELHIHKIELEMQNEQLHQTQGELEAAVTKYADFYDFAPVAYLTLDERGLILEANLTAATMLGVERRRLLQRLVINFIVREDRKIYFRHLQQLFETQGPQHYELRMVRQDGTQFWAGIAAIAVVDNNNAPLCKATISDITERKRIEEELRVGEEKYRLVSENNYHWEYWISPNGTLIYNSPSCLRITGYGPAEFIADPKLIVEIIHPEDREIFTAHYQEITDESLRTCELEFRITTKGGENRWLHHVCQPVFGDQSIWMGRRASNRDITERKWAEERLKNQMQFSETLLETIPSPVFYKNTSGRYLGCNRAFEKFLGTRREELIGKNVCEMGPKEIADKYAEMDQELFERPGSQMYEWKVRASDGSEKEVIFHKATFFDNGGKVAGLIGVILDITERKQAEENLRQTRDYLDNLITHANAPIIVWNPESKITRFNLAFENLAGYAAQEVMGRKLEMLFPEVNREESLSKIARTSEGEYWESVEISILCKDGNTRVALWNSANVYTEDGVTLVATIAQGQDITDRKRAEEAFQVLVNHAPVGIFIVQDGKCQMVNPGFEKVTGYIAGELLGKKSLTLVHPDYRESVREKSVQMLKGELDQPYEFPMITKSGETRWVMERVTDTVYRGKKATLGYFLDITEHKSLESQFLQAQKMEAVGRLAGGVAHDFNNMLNVIIGYGDLMNQKLRPQTTQARYLGEIMKASDRATALTRQLLAFSRKTISVPQILNLNDHLAGIEKMLARLIGEDIEIRMALEPDLGVVHVDPGHVEQIVMNLVVNARDALPRGGKVSLETANVYFDEDFARIHLYVTPGHYVMLAVTDNGQGMDAATQARIFEPFFTTKEVGRGTGLGLSTVYGLVKQNGGSVEVYSEVGSGTTFKVYLPEVQEAVAPVTKAKPVAMDLHGSETILVVEDEDMLRESICRGLEIFGYTVLAVRQGGEALLLGERHPGPIHLLLTDVVMPQMNGRDLADRLTPLRPDIKVLYMSGYTENAIVHHGVLETGIFFIPKPFRIKTLLGKIREILDESLRQP